MKELDRTISANEAVKMLMEQDENGNYKIGDLSGTSERENLTRIVKILNQIDLTKADEKGFENLRKALGMIGAYDRYGYIGPQEKNNKLSEFYEKSKNGDMSPARMYVNKFLGNMDAFSRSKIDDKFSDIMRIWIETSEETLGRDVNISMEKLTKEALSNDNIGTLDLDDGEKIEVKEIYREQQ